MPYCEARIADLEDATRETINAHGWLRGTRPRQGRACQGLCRSQARLRTGGRVDHRLLREHLAAYKVPRAVQFVDDLPKTSSGKIMRRKLGEIDDELADEGVRQRGAA